MREALVNKLSVAIRASLSLDDVLDTATRELGQALSASRVEVRLYDADGDSVFRARRISTPADVQITVDGL